MERVRHAAPEEDVPGHTHCNGIASATTLRGWKAVAVELAVLVLLCLLAASLALLPTMIYLWRHG